MGEINACSTIIVKLVRAQLSSYTYKMQFQILSSPPRHSPEMSSKGLEYSERKINTYLILKLSVPNKKNKYAHT